MKSSSGTGQYKVINDNINSSQCLLLVKFVQQVELKVWKTKNCTVFLYRSVVQRY